MSMTPDAKSQLSKTIRSLRTRLLADLKSSNESTYQFAASIKKAKLSVAERARRERIEEWVLEQVRTQSDRKNKRVAEDFRRDLEKQAAYTLLNRMAILRLMESIGLRKQKVATGGWEGSIYKSFRQIAPALVHGDLSEGLSFLLQLVFEELATDMPGLYGPAGAAELIPVPPATLRAVIEAFDDPVLESCWTDDMTLGWIYQYWNDPEREALDAKINLGGKIEPHEIASKTQMFTERYMVDWLLQNSLGPMWLAMCRKHGWTPEAESSGTLDALEQRRVQWRAKRDAGDVELTELMPLHTEMERHWAYYVQQPIPEDAVEHASESVRDLKILDPAVGSGHFLVVAFDLLFALYQEEARHRGETDNAEKWSDKAIVERILEHNLHGIDLDPRAVQIAAAALWMKAQAKCPEAHPAQLNLVASNLGIASLPDNDTALVELRRAVEEETGIPEKLTNQIIEALRGADHLGSLLKVDKAIEEAIKEHEKEIGWENNAMQLKMFHGERTEQSKLPFPREKTQVNLLAQIKSFLALHSSGDELGLRLRGEQLAAGVRFFRLTSEGRYDLIIANPPYQDSSNMKDSDYIEQQYPMGKADLYSAFLLRGLQLVRKGGVSAMLTMRNWMFISTFWKSGLREQLLSTFDLRALGDFDRGAFEEVPDEIVSVVASIFGKSSPNDRSIALQPTPLEDRSRDNQRTQRKRAATLCHAVRFEFVPAELKVVPEWPLVYWWDADFLTIYASTPKLGDVSPARQGMATANNARFLRRPWEVRFHCPGSLRFGCEEFSQTDHRYPLDLNRKWAPYVKGAAGIVWMEPLQDIINWKMNALENKELKGSTAGKNSEFYFMPAVAFTKIGADFSARAYRYGSVFDVAGSSVFLDEVSQAVTLLNSRVARFVLESLNPTVNFQVGDVNRLPLFELEGTQAIFSCVDKLFADHESHREPSIEFTNPGPSPWRYAQVWAQTAVDREESDPLPEYIEELDEEPPTDHVSFAFGVTLGRFGSDGQGILNPEVEDLTSALPVGMLFLDGSLDENESGDSLDAPAAKIIHEKWAKFGSEIAPRSSVRDWLRLKFFSDVHKGMYENRPMHWPLSSAKKSFVAWVNIHRWNDSTLRVLLADHLEPTLRRLDGQLNDLREARTGGDKKAIRDAEDRFASVLKYHTELSEFIASVQQCADKGPPPTDEKCPAREVDARYDPDLDDGVMINSAALWPLLEPQWNDPKKWWKQLALANPKGNKDYDWSHLAMRYFPTRVDEKCQTDPSLGVAQGCFWKYHPERAWAWELRLQDEIAADFHIEEKPYRGDGGDTEHRNKFLRENPETALEIIEKEIVRRRRNADDKIVAELALLENGLWSTIPEQCWDLETRIMKKQKNSFRLVAPDESESRANWLEENPDKVRSRSELLQKFDSTENYLPGFAEAVDPS